MNQEHLLHVRFLRCDSPGWAFLSLVTSACAVQSARARPTRPRSSVGRRSSRRIRCFAQNACISHETGGASPLSIAPFLFLAASDTSGGVRGSWSKRPVKEERRGGGAANRGRMKGEDAVG
eukprot:6181970-Pleurochrysis_carterae.AAC.2